MDAPAAPSELFQRIEASFLRQGLMHLGVSGMQSACALMRQTIASVRKTC